MDGKELRVGNWVEYFGVGYTQVTPFDIAQAIKESFERSDIDMAYKPIELTPEIFKKCGFEGDNKNDWTLRPIFLMSGHNGYHLIMRKYNNGSETSLSREIRHLHQLQNLYFALTGNEIEYKK